MPWVLQLFEAVYVPAPPLFFVREPAPSLGAYVVRKPLKIRAESKPGNPLMMYEYY